MSRAKRAQVTTMEAPTELTTSTSSWKKNGNAKADSDLEATIRARAYELYEKRGRQDGQAQNDWFQAEAELRPRVSRTA